MFLRDEFNAKIMKMTAAKTNAALDRVRKATPVDTGAAAASWHTDGNGKVVSNCEYMPTLNHGSSVKAPSYFIERAILQDSDLKPNGTIVSLQ